jgi:hypothetical protein
VLHEGRGVVEGKAPDRLTYRLGRRADGTFRETWRDDERLGGEPDPVVEWSEEDDPTE